MRRQILLALIGLAVAPLSAHAATSYSAPEMVLGAVVQPPLGFTELCQRRPEQCSVVAGGEATRAADLEAVRLWAGRARWAIVFGQQSQSALEGPATAFGGAMAYERPVRPAPVVTSSTLSWAEFQVAGLTSEPSEALASESASAPRVLAELNERDLAKVNNRVNRSIRRARDVDLYQRSDYWASPADNIKAGDCEDYVLAKRQALLDKGAPSQALSIAIVRTPQGEMHAVLLVSTAAGEMVLDNLSPWILRWDETPYRWLERQAPGTPTRWVSIASAAD